MDILVEPVPLWILKATALGVGAALGSFANVLIHRIPQGRSIVYPGSSCPACGSPIRWFDNVPVLSYVLLRGRCRSCGAPISLRYPLVEICMAVLSLACLVQAVGRMGPITALGPTLLLWWFPLVFCFLLVVVTFIDLEHWRIPPVLALVGTLSGVAAAATTGRFTGVSLTGSLLGIAAGALPLVLLIEVYFRLMKREGMGYGDVMLMAMVGANLGWEAIPFVLLASSLQGILVSVPLVLLKKTQPPPWEEDSDDEAAEPALRHAPVPFGPFIALAALEWQFFGAYLVTLLMP